MTTSCIEAVEFLQDQLGASGIELRIDKCADYARACEELGGETTQRITIPHPNRVMCIATGWSGMRITHTCYSVPECGGKR